MEKELYFIMENKFELPEAECKKCGWKWTVRISNPRKCPHCGNPNINKPLSRKPYKPRDKKHGKA